MCVAQSLQSRRIVAAAAAATSGKGKQQTHARREVALPEQSCARMARASRRVCFLGDAFRRPSQCIGSSGGSGKFELPPLAEPPLFAHVERERVHYSASHYLCMVAAAAAKLSDNATRTRDERISACEYASLTHLHTHALCNSGTAAPMPPNCRPHDKLEE